MKPAPVRFRPLVVAILAVTMIPVAVRANISGFGDFSQFTINVDDSGSAPTLSPGSIQLTNNTGLESRSVFYNTPQSISQFSASFTYQNAGVTYPNSGNNGIYGATFCLQNSAAGAAAVCGNGVNAFGYGNEPFSPGIGTSAAITFEMQPPPTLSGLYTNGNLGGGSLNTSPVNLVSGDPINVTLIYNGLVLHESLFDTVTSQSYDAFFAANLPSILGGPTAFVGVTASTGNSNTSSGSDGFQTFSNFQFNAGVAPEPASLTVLLMGAGATGMARPRKKARC